MVVLEQYLQLYERDSKLVSSAWKIFHICFYVVIALSGISASYTFSQVLASFGGSCILHSNVTFSNKTENGSTTYLIIDCLKTEWGRQSDCSFCLFVPICSVIFSIVWTTFFLMCGRGGKTARGLSQPWRIVLPSLIFNVVFFGVALAAACKLHEGFRVFCKFFQEEMDEPNCQNLNRYQLAEGNSGLQTYRYMMAAQISAWINVGGWVMGILLLLLRCFCAPDFQLVEVSILVPTPVKEEGEGSALITVVTERMAVTAHERAQQHSNKVLHATDSLTVFFNEGLSSSSQESVDDCMEHNDMGSKESQA